MTKVFTRTALFLLVAALTMFSKQVSASHIMGSDITFRCLGGNNYQVVVTVYRDCSGISAPTSIPVDVSSSCGTQTITLTQDPTNSGVEVSQLCPTAISTCQGGSLPGVQVYTYVGNVTVQPNCGLYTFQYDDCCRNPSNNIVNPTAQGFMVRATLNSNLVTCNTAPQFTSLPVPYFCLGQSVNYSHGAVDAEGDSLVYSLIAPLDDLGANIAYTGTFTAANPMTTAGGFNFDSQTGQMTFTPTAQGVYVVDVLVREFRNGVLIGTTMRDIQIVIINCANQAPVVNNCLNLQNVTGGVVVDCNSLGVCPGQTVSFTVGAKDPNGQPITVSSNLAQSIPTASLTTQTVGADSVRVTFTWTPTGADTGFRYFTIQFEDNACPITGLQLFTYDITVLDGTDAGPDRFYCTGGGPVTIAVSGGNTFSWNTTSGFVSATTPDSAVVQVAPLTTTTYIVQSDLQGGCKNRDTVTVFNVQTFTTNVSATEDTICLNESTDLTVVGTPSTQGPFTYNWAPVVSGGVQSPNAATTEVRPTSTGFYYVTVTSASGCPIKDSIQIVIQGVGPKVVVSASDNFVCPGDPVTLNTLVKALECGPTADPLNPCLPNSSFAIQDLGTGTGTAGANVTPYIGFWMDGRVQYLYRASELQALGLAAGTITDIAFNVITKNSTAPYNNFTIKMGCTGLQQLPTNFVSGLTQVLNPVSYTTTTGWNTHTLDIPYQWDGFTNLIVEICFDNSAFTQYDNVAFTATSFPGSVLWDNADLTTSSGCSALTTPVTGQNRPNTRFIMCVAPLSNYSFTWTGSNGTTLPNTPNPTVNVFDNVQYTVVVDDGTCQGDTTISLFVDSAVIIVAGPDTVICGTDSVQLNAFLPNPAVPVCVPNYTVAPITYNPINAVAPPTAGPSGDDVVSSAITLPFPFEYFCTSYSQFFISTNGFITFSAGQGSGLTAQAVPNATTPNNVVALCWEDLLSNAGVITHYVSGTAPNRRYIIRFNNAGFFGASGNVSGQIQLHETTNAIEIHLASQTATGQNATLGIENANGTVGVAPQGYNLGAWTVSSPVAFRFTPQTAGAGLVGVQWSPAAGLSNTTILNPKALPNTTTDYVVQATFTNGCVTYDTVRIAIGNFPYTVSVQPDSICAGDTAQLFFNGNGVSYNWTPAGSLSSATVQNPLASPAVTTDYVVTAFDSIGCRAEDTLRVVVRTIPPVTLGPDQTVCPTDSTTLTPSGGPYFSYNWSTGATTPTINTAAQTAAAQDYWVRVNDGNCFYNSDTVTINEYILQPIVVQPSGDTAVCIGDSIVLSAAPGYVTYVWTNSPAGTSQITVSAAGIYTYYAVDNNGCVIFAADTANVISVQRPVADIATTDNSICANQSTATLSVTPVQGIAYTWNPGGVQGATLTVDTAGIYTLIADDNGCRNFDTIVITETLPPLADLGDDQNVCSCDTSIILLPGAGASFNWSDGTTNPNLVVSQSGTYAVTITDNNDCTATDQVSIQVNCLTANAFVADPAQGSVFVGQNAGLNVTTSYSSDFTYLWSPSIYLDDSTKKDPSVQGPQQTTIYNVTVVDIVNGCVTSDTTQLKVLPPGIPPMPNAFTPNGDGNNDTYGPYIPPAMQGIYTIAEMRIYNRWGQLIYNSTAPWDGYFGGALQPADTYIYYIVIEGPDQNNPSVITQFTDTGSFTLLH